MPRVRHKNPETMKILYTVHTYSYLIRTLLRYMRNSLENLSFLPISSSKYKSPYKILNISIQNFHTLPIEIAIF